MPITPLDLQQLFGQMGRVGKEQSALKEGAALHQAMMQGAGIKKKEETKEALKEPEDPEEGADAVPSRLPDKERQGRSKGAKTGAPDGDEEEDREGSDRDGEGGRIRDHRLGNNLDITG